MNKDIFTGIEEELATHGNFIKPKNSFSLQSAKEILHAAFSYFLGSNFTWIDEYNSVVAWLENNEGLGLYLYGKNGNGKTVLCKKIIPAIMLKYHRKVFRYYDYQDINTKADEMLTKHFISIDDIGNEEQSVSFGNRRWILPEIMDLAEKRNGIVILSSNLNGEQLVEKYGIRTFERIVSCTKRIEFKHKSFRT